MMLFCKITMLEPIGINRILERHDSGLVVENVFLDKRLARPSYRCRRTDAISIHYFRRGNGRFSCYQSLQIVELLGRQCFGDRYEQQTQLFDQRRVSFLDNLFGTGSRCSEPRKLRQLLDIVRVIVCQFDNRSACLIGDYLSRGCKPFLDEIDQIRCLYFVQENQISEFVKRLEESVNTSSIICRLLPYKQ